MLHSELLSIALFMMITSAVCWGSWANTYKGVKNYRFEFSTGITRSASFWSL